MRQRLAAHIARATVAGAIGRGEGYARFRRCSVGPVAKAQMRRAVPLDFGNEAGKLAVLVEQVFDGSPALCRRRCQSVICGVAVAASGAGKLEAEGICGCRHIGVVRHGEGERTDWPGPA